MLNKEILIHFIRNISIDPISNYLKKVGLNSNLNYDITFSNYRELDDGLVDFKNQYSQNNFDYVFGFIWPNYTKFEKADDLTSYLKHIGELTKSMNTEKVFLNTLIPYAPALGLQSTSAELNKIYEGNNVLAKLAENNPFLSLVDLNKIVNDHGIVNTYDPRFWYLYNQPFTNLFYKEMSKTIQSQGSLISSKTIKVIVLDCDNTLWGGILGEEGINNIRLGSGAFPGNIYTDFQAQIKKLKDSGILLAICSKNNEQDVFDAFNQNLNFVLKQDDFVATRINWQDKVTNILSISQDLNLGLDSFLFIDDSSFEIENVRVHLPEVNTFQIPANKFQICNHFENFISQFNLDLTQKNDLRLESYKAEKIRQNLKLSYANVEEYLNSLQMNIEINRMSDKDTVRCAELIQRTNQFNSTGEKISIADLKAKLISSNMEYFTLRASDRFGDYGLVGLASIGTNNDFSEIDTFMLSCRILGRQVERLFLSIITQVYVPQNISEIRFRYIMNNKNIQVLEFLNSVGFENDGKNVLRSTRSKLFSMLKYPQNYKIKIGSQNEL